ncbi:VOC family protein [Acidocella sp.]|uniref:VOC family protein n=1 Tax=Acidocella sp. TaxID=50710 RepID=UPI003D0594AA
MRILPELYDPPFRVTRASHVELRVRDLAAARAFYVDCLGFVVSDETSEVLYLRGLEEIAHHSLVLRRGDASVAQRVGFRCLTEEDLDRAKFYFDQEGLPTAWVEVAHQGRGFQALDPSGVPLEFCARMQTRPRLIGDFAAYRGGCPLRLDHFQLFTPDVARAYAFYTGMGFRLSDYIVEDGTLIATFMQRKGNPHDVVFLRAPGPQLHHIAYTVPGNEVLLGIGDRLAQGGLFHAVEWGPNRHWGPGWARSLYLRDPEGHRIEFFLNHYQCIDIDETPVGWTLAELKARPGWGAPPPRSWLLEAKSFVDMDLKEPDEMLLGGRMPFELVAE